MRANAECGWQGGRYILAVLALLFLVTLMHSPAWAASVWPQEVDGASGSEATLRIFLDCKRHCDFDYLRRVVPFVDYVLDRRDADVHVLVTNRRTGAGDEFSLQFIGIGEFADKSDTHVFASSDTDTDDEVRKALGSVLTLGIAPYLLRTPLATQMRTVHDSPSGLGLVATPDEDPWNFWVFRQNLPAR